MSGHPSFGTASMSPEDYASQNLKDAEAWWERISKQEAGAWEAYSRRIDSQIAESREELTECAWDHEHGQLVTP